MSDRERDGANNEPFFEVDPIMLSREGAASLTKYSPDLGYDGDLYGDRLSALVGGFPDSWLEAAVLAGYVPNGDALALAIRAYHVWWREIWHEAPGDAFAPLTNVTYAYREMVAILERCVIEVEEIAETALRASAERDREADRGLSELAEAARTRLHRAQTRLRSVEDDNRKMSSLAGGEGDGEGDTADPPQSSAP